MGTITFCINGESLNRLGPTGLSSNILSPTGLGSIRLGPTRLDPNWVGPTGVRFTGLGYKDLGPNILGPTWLGPTALASNVLGPIYMRLIDLSLHWIAAQWSRYLCAGGSLASSDRPNIYFNDRRTMQYTSITYSIIDHSSLHLTMFFQNTTRYISISRSQYIVPNSLIQNSLKPNNWAWIHHLTLYGSGLL